MNGKNKIVIKEITGAGILYKKAMWQNNDQWLSAEVWRLGTFQAFADVVPPQLNDLGTADTMILVRLPGFAFWPTDNFGSNKNFQG